MWDFTPCPVCVQDDADYGEPCAVERGGTAVLRVSDAWIRTLEPFYVFGTARDEVFEGAAAPKELARILHGEAYEAFLNAIMQNGVADAEVLCPELYEDDGLLAMHARHIGGAWYLVFRPDEDGRKRMKDEGRLAIDLWFDGGVIRWQGGALTLVAWPPSEEEALDLELGAIKGKPGLDEARAFGASLS
jgi:hypothetical protein